MQGIVQCDLWLKKEGLVYEGTSLGWLFFAV